MGTVLAVVIVALVSVAGPRQTAADSGSIAFTKLHASGSGISVVAATGVPERVLTRHRGWRDSQPEWSPDGKLIAFTRSVDRGRSMHIYVMRANGSNVRRITSGAFDERAAWAPSGRWIAYQSLRGIRLVHPDGTHNHLLARTRAGASYPAWSADGKWLAWTRPNAGRTEETVVQRLDGSGLRRLLNGREPDWSADGRTIAFTGPDGGIFRMPAAGGKVLRLGSGMQPSWLPGGKQIAFARWPGGNSFSLWLMSPDGSHRSLVVANALDPDASR